MASISQAAPSAAHDSSTDRGFFGHPRGLATLFFTEMWERFSYYGMRALLILFMTASVANGGLGFDAATAGPIYGLYTSMVYLTALPGGWFADRVIGQQRAVLIGGIIIMFGHISLAMEGMSFFLLGLFLVIFGTGLLKPNISTIVGQLYSAEDARRDSGFSLFYMGINLGAFAAPLICGFLAQHPRFHALLASWGMDPNRSWHWGFGAAAVGMFFGIIQYLLGNKYLRGAGRQPADPLSDSGRKTALGAMLALLIGGGALLVIASNRAIAAMATVNRVMAVLLLGTSVLFFVWLLTAGSRDREERKRHLVILVLFLGASVFWSAFEQAGSTLNLFAEQSTSRSFLGMNVPASYLQSVNSLFLIILSPVFAWFWLWLGKREPSTPTKFTFGLFFLSLGFAVLIPAAQFSAGGVAKVSAMWLVMTYLFHTIGELCLSPVGLSAMTKLAPARYAGLMLGVWFLASSVGNFIGGNVAGLYESFSTAQIFTAVTVFVLAACLLLLVFVQPIKRMLARP
ncbi:MAG TPA: peptide MFS transporter [Gemmatimonadales bacterium]|nr:peptide MFS transporter [Gemmatimonadales bacterium]